MQAILLCLQESDSNCQLFGTLFFGILSDDISTHSIICVPDVIQPLFALSVSQDSTTEVIR